MSMKYYPIKKERFEKIQKTKDPGPGFYKTEEGFRKTLLNSCEHQFVKTGKSCFFGIIPTSKNLETEAKKRSYVPGVGHYKEVDNALKKTVRPRTAGKKY